MYECLQLLSSPLRLLFSSFFSKRRMFASPSALNCCYYLASSSQDIGPAIILSLQAQFLFFFFNWLLLISKYFQVKEISSLTFGPPEPHHPSLIILLPFAFKPVLTSLSFDFCLLQSGFCLYQHIKAVLLKYLFNLALVNHSFHVILYSK